MINVARVLHGKQPAEEEMRDRHHLLVSVKPLAQSHEEDVRDAPQRLFGKSAM
jgi:hypothetical protein